jgi:hypothetical protein
LQHAFGIGRHERIRDLVSMRIIIAVDGHLGNPNGPDYARLEQALIEGAFDIAAEADRRNAQTNATAKLRAMVRFTRPRLAVWVSPSANRRHKVRNEPCPLVAHRSAYRFQTALFSSFRLQ